MDLETTAFERALHLALFVAGGLTAGLVALALLERLGGEGRRFVRPLHVGVVGAVFLGLFVAERVYHM